MRRYKGELCRLSELALGQRGRVLSVDFLKNNVRRHLMEMGIVKGTEFIVKKKAPMGNPIIILLRGYELCLRLEVLRYIRVEVI